MPDGRFVTVICAELLKPPEPCKVIFSDAGVPPEVSETPEGLTLTLMLPFDGDGADADPPPPQLTELSRARMGTMV